MGGCAERRDIRPRNTRSRTELQPEEAVASSFNGKVAPLERTGFPVVARRHACLQCRILAILRESSGRGDLDSTPMADPARTTRESGVVRQVRGSTLGLVPQGIEPSRPEPEGLPKF